jgi:hypothetical protein
MNDKLSFNKLAVAALELSGSGMVKRDEGSWLTASVIFAPRLSTTASAFDPRIRLSTMTIAALRSAYVHLLMCGLRSEHLDVFFSVIARIVVFVMDYFAWPKVSSKKFFSHKPMFENTPSLLGMRVFWAINEYIAQAIDATTTPPIGIQRSELSFIHTCSIAKRCYGLRATEMGVL